MSSHSKITQLSEKWRALRKMRSLQSKQSADQLESLFQQEQELIAELGQAEAYGELESELPILLFPVRLETRYFRPDGNLELRVRVFPDTIHVDSHNPNIATFELQLAKAYWNVRYQHGIKASATRNAWAQLSKRVGTPRGQWLASQLVPKNLQEAPKGAPAFPPMESIESHNPQLVATARVLPDRWAFCCTHSGSESTHWGQPVRSELPVGPNANAKELPDFPGAIDEGNRWLVDFAEAEKRGMAIRISLPNALQRVDKLIVLGVRASIDSEESEKRVSELLEMQRASDGFSLLSPDTPTNNTEEERSGLRVDQVATPESFAAFHEKAPLPASCQGARLGSALGLGEQALASVEHARHDRESATSAMHTALWPATWGYYLEQMIQPSLRASDLGKTRSHFIKHVRAAGALPSLRIGKQPYGILPVTCLARFHDGASDDYRRRLARFLRTQSNRWLDSVPRVPRLAQSGDPSAELDEILTMTPRSVHYFARSAKTREFLIRTIQTIIADAAVQNGLIAAIDATTLATLQPHLAALGTTPPSMPAISKLIFEEAAVQIGVPLVAAKDIERSAPLPDNYIAAILDASLATLRSEELAGASPKTLLYMLLRHAALQEYVDAGFRLLGKRKPLETSEKETASARIWKKVQEPSIEKRLLSKNLSEASLADLREFKASLQTLQTSSVAELERLSADTLDLSSHRLDAWITSVATSRLAELRTTKPRGLHIGGFGWLEGLAVPSDVATDDGAETTDLDNEGYIHAPSLAQAKTAAILRSAYLAHPESEQSFAVDLSSRRVKAATQLLDALRQGQELGAVLGYRIERMLLENGAGRTIAQLRRLAPLQSSTSDKTAPSLVVDGVRLHALWKEDAAQVPVEVRNILISIDDVIDATGDVLLAESVHQATTGQSSRAAAGLDFLADGDVPAPDPGIVKTPSSDRKMGHRVMVLLSGNPGWPGDSTRLRAIAAPELNAWAAAVIGSPEQVHFRVDYLNAEDQNPVHSREHTLADVDLCALDLVHLSHSAASGNETPLHQLLAQHFEPLAPPHWAPGSFRTIVGSARDSKTAAKEMALDEAMTLARSLRALCGLGRELRPTDTQPPPSAIADDTGEALATLRAYAAGVEARLEALLALPKSEQRWHASVLSKTASSTGLELSARLDLMRSLRSSALSEVRARLAAVFGKDFLILAPLPNAATTALHEGMSDQSALVQDEDEVSDWVTDYGKVRKPVEALSQLLTAVQAHRPLSDAQLQVAQFPHRPGMPWIGLAANPSESNEPRLSMVVHTPLGTAGQGPWVGLYIDSWSEGIPSNHHTTGLSLHYDDPKSRAPQSMLLAVPPSTRRGWSFQTLRAIVEESFDLVKIRMVDGHALENMSHFLPAQLIADNLLEDTVSLNMLQYTMHYAEFPS